MRIFNPESAPKRADKEEVAWEMAKVEEQYQNEIQKSEADSSTDEAQNKNLKKQKDEAVDKRGELYEKAIRLAESLIENALRSGKAEYIPKWPINLETGEISNLTEMVLLERLTDNEMSDKGRVANYFKDNKWKNPLLTFKSEGPYGLCVRYEGKVTEERDQPDFSPSSKRLAENITDYERQKIENTLAQAEMVVDIIKSYLKAVDLVDEIGNKPHRSVRFDKLLYPGAPAGPGNHMIQIRQRFESGLAEITHSLNTEDQIELQKRIDEIS